METAENPTQAVVATKYRANRKKFFLTYPQCSLTPERILEFFQRLAPIDKFLIAKENHADGNPHIHAYISFVDKQDFKNSRWADIDGHHPNDGGSIRNEAAVSKYCTKNGNFITNFFKLDVYTLIFSEDVTQEEAIKLIKEKRPRDYALYHNQIEGALKKSKFKAETPLFKPSEFNIPLQEFEMNLLVYGETDLGKTAYAETHFNTFLKVTHVDALKGYDPRYHEGIIFNDMEFHHWPISAVIHLLSTDEKVNINVKHSIVTLPAGRRQIFTSNLENPFYLDTCQESQKSAVDRRVKKFLVMFPTYSEKILRAVRK